MPLLKAQLNLVELVNNNLMAIVTSFTIAIFILLHYDLFDNHLINDSHEQYDMLRYPQFYIIDSISF